jgi:ribosomal protein S18 acetylase RimI-like enzyme
MNELDGLGWQQSQIDAFIRMQFMAQARCYPVADNRIIVVDHEPAGRILVDSKPEHLLLVDISLLPQYRNRGIGTGLIRELLKRGEAEGKSVLLHVLATNPAVRLYERLGFSITGDETTYLEMTWMPSHFDRKNQQGV